MQPVKQAAITATATHEIPDSWAAYLATQGREASPPRKGGPVLTMASTAQDSQEDAFGERLKPKLAAEVSAAVTSTAELLFGGPPVV